MDVGFHLRQWLIEHQNWIACAPLPRRRCSFFLFKFYAEVWMLTHMRLKDDINQSKISDWFFFIRIHFDSKTVLEQLTIKLELKIHLSTSDKDFLIRKSARNTWDREACESLKREKAVHGSFVRFFSPSFKAIRHLTHSKQTSFWYWNIFWFVSTSTFANCKVWNGEVRAEFRFLNKNVQQY